MRRFTVVTPLVAGALLLPMAAPATAGTTAGPIGATVQLVTSGLAFGDFTYPLAADRKLTIQKHVLDAGEIITWRGEGTTVAINQTGVLTHFASCKTQQTWRAFPAYYTVRSKQLGTLTGVTINQGRTPVELFTITSGAVGNPQTNSQLHRHSGDEIESVGDLSSGGEDEEVGADNIVDPIVAANGCPQGAPGETSTLAEGVMAESAAIELIDHNQIAVYRHSVPAGYNSGWFSPFDPTFIVPVSGDITAQSTCTDAAARRAGDAFMAAAPTLVRSTGAAEYLSVSWNIQNGMSVEQPFYIPELPPTDCPDSVLK